MNVIGLRDLGSRSWSQVHNVYLQIGTEIGLAGLVIYLLLIGQLLKGLRLSLKQLKGLPEGRTLFALGQGVEIGLLAFLVQAMFHPVAYHMYFYYIAGFAVAHGEITKRLLLQPRSVS